MPAFNEEATILEAVQAALDADLPVDGREVIVVENGSRDRTRELLHSRAWPKEVKIVEIDENRGKGGAVRLGVEHAEGTYMAVLDADLEYDPEDYAVMIPPLRDGFDAVLGTRYWQSHSAFGYWYVMGNKAISTAANMMFNSYLSDCMVGMKLLPVELFRSLGLTENGFGFDAEVVARLLRRRARIYEVPVHYRARSRDEGKKLRATDGLRMLKVFVKCRFS